MSAYLESIAKELESSPDYRVLRRLQPCLNFAPPGDAARTIQVLILDTETTGLEAENCKLIELALLRVAVDIDAGVPVGPVDIYDGLEDPGTPLAPEIVALTGLTDDMLKGQRLDEVRIAQMLQGVDLVIAHNAGFDRPFAQRRVAGFSAIPWACSWADVDWKAHGHASAKLESLALDKGWFYDAHRADADCHALLAVLNAVIPAIGKTGFSSVLKTARKDRVFIEALAAPFETKDVLKASGYKWDSARRLWGKTVRDGAPFDDELQWLSANIYAGAPARVSVRTVSPLQRFTQDMGPASIVALAGQGGQG